MTWTRKAVKIKMITKNNANLARPMCRAVLRDPVNPGAALPVAVLSGVRRSKNPGKVGEVWRKRTANCSARTIIWLSSGVDGRPGAMGGGGQNRGWGLCCNSRVGTLWGILPYKHHQHHPLTRAVAAVQWYYWRRHDEARSSWRSAPPQKKGVGSGAVKKVKAKHVTAK